MSWLPSAWWWLRRGGVGVGAKVETDSDRDSSSPANAGGFKPVGAKSATASTPSSDWSYSCITSIKCSIGFSPLGTFRPIRDKWRVTSLGDPWYMSCPRARIMRWSRSDWILHEGWWIVRITVLPERAMWCTFSMTLWALVESRPEVGSSRKSNDGPWMMSTPMETLRRSPPDTPLVPSSPMYVFRHDYNIN
jgi:hypothetical protein